MGWPGVACTGSRIYKGVGIALGRVTACTFQQGECIPGLNTVEVNPYVALNLLLVPYNPCSRNVFLVPINSNIYAS